MYLFIFGSFGFFFVLFCFFWFVSFGLFLLFCFLLFCLYWTYFVLSAYSTVFNYSTARTNKIKFRAPEPRRSIRGA